MPQAFSSWTRNSSWRSWGYPVPISRRSRGAGLVGRRLSCLCLLGVRQGEKRADIPLNSFGFYANGSLEVDLSLLRLGLQETEEKDPLVRGFEEFAGGGRGAHVSHPHLQPPVRSSASHPWAGSWTSALVSRNLRSLICNVGIIKSRAVCAGP